MSLLSALLDLIVPAKCPFCGRVLDRPGNCGTCRGELPWTEGADALRRANVLGVYEAVDPERISGHRILLVDDICTTGATLAECARVLREAGAADVVCAAAALTPLERDSGQKA